MMQKNTQEHHWKELIKSLNETENLPQAMINASQDTSCGVYIQGALSENHTGAKRNWQSRNYNDVIQNISKIVALLQELNVKKGDSIAIISNTRSEWSETDYAIMALGAITVSVYPSLNEKDIAYILHDSKASIVFAENEEIVQKIKKIIETETTIPANELHPEISIKLSELKVITFEPTDGTINESNLSQIQNKSATDLPAIIKNNQIRREDTASIVYTSGTTGAPKGVVQTHGNHLSNIRQAVQSGVFGIGEKLFLYLPLAHSFARLIHHIGFTTPSILVFPAITNHRSSKIDLSALGDDIRESNSNYLPTVPRLFEKIRTGIINESKSKTLKGMILRLCIEWSHRYYVTKDNAPLLQKFVYSATKKIRSKIKQNIFGNNFKHAIVGGAKFDPDINHFFESLDIQIYEGYGLTETCVATNVNLPHQRKIGSVGPLFEDVEIKIANDGEIHFRGPNIAKGYFNRPLATSQSWDKDGWFCTGDIGHIDKDGFLFITDRKKDILVTAGGKKVAPIPIEALIKKNSIISQALLFGDGKPYCIALLWLLNNHGINAQNENTIQDYITEINKTLSNFEQIKKFIILKDEPSIENGLLTPTLKVKKKEVFARYKNEIENLYSG